MPSWWGVESKQELSRGFYFLLYFGFIVFSVSGWLPQNMTEEYPAREADELCMKIETKATAIRDEKRREKGPFKGTAAERAGSLPLKHISSNLS